MNFEAKIPTGPNAAHPDQDLVTFPNKQFEGRQFGAWTIEFTSAADVEKLQLPPSVTAEGNQVRIPNGALTAPEALLSSRIDRPRDTLDLSVISNGNSTNWPLSKGNIRCIRDGDGKLYWVNKQLLANGQG